MKMKGLLSVLGVTTFVLLSYSAAGAQVVDKVKETAGKTKDVTVDAAKKTGKVTKDVADKTRDVTVDAAKKTVVVTSDLTDKTKDATVNAAKATASGAKKFGNYTVELTDTVKGETYEGGRWLVVTTWDGVKWVSKRAWFPNKTPQ